jgi:hypothetical protein
VGRALTQAQEDSIQRTIINKRPEQLKMDFLLFRRSQLICFGLASARLLPHIWIP